MRRRLTSLLVLLLALRCLVPTGFMLAPAGSDGFAVVICTGSGPQSVVLDQDGQPAEHDQGVAEHTLCAFAPAGAMAAADQAPDLRATEAIFAVVTYERVEDLRESEDWTGARARGPPVQLA